MYHDPDSLHARYDLAPGDMVAVRFAGVLSHYGVMTQRGTVITNSNRNNGVVEQTLAEFADGRPVRRCARRGGLDALAVEARARRAKGAPYSLTHSNCSHFARWTHRRRPTLMQAVSATFEAFRDMSRNTRGRY